MNNKHVFIITSLRFTKNPLVDSFALHESVQKGKIELNDKVLYTRDIAQIENEKL